MSEVPDVRRPALPLVGVNGTGDVLVPGFSELLVLGLHLAVVLGTLTLARSRGRSGIWWGFAAMFFSVLATVALVAVDRRDAPPRRAWWRDAVVVLALPTLLLFLSSVLGALISTDDGPVSRL